MPRRSRVLGMIMAGGKGERLQPLTRDRSKPAVPFGGRHRIIDFVLSNFVNSELPSIYVLVQYKSQSLIEHLRVAWRTSGQLPDVFVTVVPPQMRSGSDYVYRMDVTQMLAAHQAVGADVTIAARPVPGEAASALGVLRVDARGRL